MSKAHALQWQPRSEAVVSFGRAPEARDEWPMAGRLPPEGSARASASRAPETGRRDWAAALEALSQAAHLHQARRDELRELETRVHERLKRLEAELLQAESRAQAAERRALEAERRAAEAEEWLQRMYDRINEHFGVEH